MSTESRAVTARQDAAIAVDFDPQDPGDLDEPFEQYESLSSGCPVVYSTRGDAYLITRWEAIREAYRRPDLFSNEGSFEFGGSGMAPALVTADDPVHKRQRAILNKAFTARRVATMEPYVTDLADRLIDRFIDDGECDIVENYSMAIPGTVVADLVGAPVEDVPNFRRWADDTLLAVGNAEKYRELAGVAAMELRDYVLAAAAQRRQAIEAGDPPDDLLTAMLVADMDGERLSDAELFPICWQLLVAGHDTTMGLISNSLYLLSAHPEQKQKLLEDMSLLEQAIEEILRFWPPAHWMPRRCTRDAEFADSSISAESRVILLNGCANREPGVWADPDAFDITRPLADTRRKTLTFGFGAHTCLGSNLGRLEGKVALKRLLERMPDIEVDRTKPNRKAFRPPNQSWDELWVRWSRSA